MTYPKMSPPVDMAYPKMSTPYIYSPYPPFRLFWIGKRKGRGLGGMAIDDGTLLAKVQSGFHGRAAEEATQSTDRRRRRVQCLRPASGNRVLLMSQDISRRDVPRTWVCSSGRTWNGSRSPFEEEA